MRHVPHVVLSSPWEGPSILLDDSQSHHLTRVLRFSPGAAVSYTDGQGRRGWGTLGEGAITRGDEATVAKPSPPIGLAVAPPRSVRRQRFLVEKLAELGVDRLTWIITEHTEGRPPKADKARAWAIAALEQSAGAWLMDVDGPTDIDQLAAEPGTLWVAERESFPPPSVVEGGIIVIGPEGGLDKGEAPETAMAFGLGKRVLRVETAAMTAATLFLDRCGRLRM